MPISSASSSSSIQPPTFSAPPADQAAQRITVPQGFAIRIFAQGLNNPRLMTFGPDGILYVALTGAGQIVRLPDRNHDGLSDGTEVVASGLNRPHSVEWQDSFLYVAEGDKVERLSAQDATGKFTKRDLIIGNLPCCSDHFTRTLHFGPDGKLYITIGSSCNLCIENDPRLAAMLRINPDGSIPSDNPFANDPDTLRGKQSVWAYGLRNSVDFLWTKEGQLWANMMGVDALGDNTPPEVIVTRIERGKSYGWPYCYNPGLGANTSASPLVRDTRIALPPGFGCSQAVPALFTDLAHSAPLGMSFANGSNFPASYRNDLYVAYHGSWNTDIVANYRDCKVQRIVIQNGQPVSSETFATGWRGVNAKCGDASTWGRPADVIFGPDGKMYISDDKGGRVYIISYVGS